jgi:hypothetical protein
MTNIHNERYLEDARAMYEEAAEKGDTELAQSLLQDLRDKGFRKEADYLERPYKSVSEILAEAADRTVRGN